ncbi:MAG: DNA adenine methylase [Planctomycetota bacterium]
MRTIWYMGVKTRLTDAIAAAVEEAAPRAGAVCDLMSGTAAVSTDLARRYAVAANDVQAYACAIATAYICHGPDSRRALQELDPERDLGAAYRQNRDLLLARLGPAVALEDAFLRAAGLEPEAREAREDPRDRQALGAADPEPAPRRGVPRDARERASAYRTFALRSTPAFEEERDVPASGPFRGARELYSRAWVLARRASPRAFPYHLCTSYYPNVYLGLRQAIAVDSLRYAIDQLGGPGAELRRAHYLAALLHAASVTTSATSHFCQPRGLVRDAEVDAVLQRRAVSIPSRLLAFSRAIRATVAGIQHRPGNRATCSGWRGALGDPALRADVVYADPPYTADNYSRFYHVLEVLTRYDYPELEVKRGRVTKGRYPVLGARHRSGFCHRRQVERELAALVEACAARGAALVLSYGEENGLLFKVYRDQGLSPRRARERFLDLARARYRSVRLETETLMHSGQGDSNHQVTELLLIARGVK